jgi:hypothetical protein
MSDDRITHWMIHPDKIVGGYIARYATKERAEDAARKMAIEHACHVVVYRASCEYRPVAEKTEFIWENLK